MIRLKITIGHQWECGGAETPYERPSQNGQHSWWSRKAWLGRNTSDALVVVRHPHFVIILKVHQHGLTLILGMTCPTRQ